MSSKRKKLSIVVPVYFNELNIPHTLPRLRNLENLLPRYELEFVFVDDGSRDKSFQLLHEEFLRDPRIIVVRLSKNFGSMSAIEAGLNYATGDCVGIIAADLQDPPELFAEMVRRWEGGKKIVMATRRHREDPFVERLFSNTYYYILDKFALSGYPRGGFDFVLVDKQIVQEVISISEKNTNIMSLIFWLGHDQDSIQYVRQERIHGESKWTFPKKVKLFVDSFVSFSYAPVRFMSFVGFGTASLSFLYGVYVIINTLNGNIRVQGWTTIVTIVSFLLGLIMIMLGTIGEYLWRILDESRNRPRFVVDQVLLHRPERGIVPSQKRRSTMISPGRRTKRMLP